MSSARCLEEWTAQWQPRSCIKCWGSACTASLWTMASSDTRHTAQLLLACIACTFFSTIAISVESDTAQMAHDVVHKVKDC